MLTLVLLLYRINRMPLAERFLSILIGLKHYQLKIEFMLLQEEFYVNVPALERAITCLRKAAYEIMRSYQLQEIFTCVLVAGNFLNFVSYHSNTLTIWSTNSYHRVRMLVMLEVLKLCHCSSLRKFVQTKQA